VQCRPDARYRDRDDPGDFIETLCDIGSSEMLLPLPWFAEDANTVCTGEGVLQLAAKYSASREATVRRTAEMSQAVVAALFLSWKLKPAQTAKSSPKQRSFLSVTPEE
jgi:Zn-dependent peptidase ImmA (M78 family)